MANIFVDSFQKIQGAIFRALGLDINKRIKSNSPKFIQAMKILIPKWIEEQPEIASLRSHGVPESLSAQFGIEAGNEGIAIEKIVSVLSESINVIVVPVDDLLNGGVEFVFNPDVFARLIGTSEGTVVTEKGTNLDWLDWLITKGDLVIITGYHYVPSQNGRSGGGTMRVGNIWRVPPEFSGTEDNNFITRAFENREPEIERLLQDILK